MEASKNDKQYLKSVIERLAEMDPFPFSFLDDVKCLNDKRADTELTVLINEVLLDAGLHTEGCFVAGEGILRYDLLWNNNNNYFAKLEILQREVFIAYSNGKVVAKAKMDIVGNVSSVNVLSSDLINASLMLTLAERIHAHAAFEYLINK